MQPHSHTATEAKLINAFRSLPDATQKRLAQQRIGDAVYALATVPLPPGVKKLKGKEGRFRIRVGDYRIIYTIDGGALIISY